MSSSASSRPPASSSTFDDARDGKVELDTTPIENMMGRYAAQQADCGSLERYLTR